METSEVICAVSTAPGIGAIAVLRMSGTGCIALTDRIFESPSGKKLTGAKANTVHFGRILEEGCLLDEVLVTIFHAPHSFTGEESVEIACHGSLYIQQRLLQLLVNQGARLATPGEFTQRAFLNGKMDLSQAEAVGVSLLGDKEGTYGLGLALNEDEIYSAASHRMALKQMKGGFSAELMKLRAELLHITSLLELELDFSEEDVEFADRSELRRIAGNIDELLTRLCRSFSLGNVIKNGVPVAIVGNTNVGKSTLLNALLREDRAIVSDIAGTTRDVIEDTINLNGITFRFIDTAGIRATSDEVENIGIERTFAKIGQASVVLLLTDLNRGVESFEEYYHQVKSRLTSDAKLIIVLNKTDQVEDLLTPQETIRLFTSGEEIIPISARTGANLDRLIQELTRTVNLNTLNTSDVIVSNVRHYEALRNARTAIERVNEGLESGLSGEFISQDIRECLHYLGEITGEITTDEVLGNIFKNFCIGK